MSKPEQLPDTPDVSEAETRIARWKTVAEASYEKGEHDEMVEWSIDVLELGYKSKVPDIIKARTFLRLCKLHDDFAAMCNSTMRLMQEQLLSQSTTDTQRLTKENAELRKENERLQSWLNTPTIVGLEDCGYFAEVDYDGLKDHLVGVNKPMRLDWANRLVDGEWYAANIVTIWNEDGDWEETELHLYPSKQLAQQAVDASVALRPSTIPEGSTRG